MVNSYCYLSEINLSNFRNFSEISLNFSNKSNLIIGRNGSGKTNLLESISLLMPGKGLRGCKFDDLVKSNSDYWQVFYSLNSYIGAIKLFQKHSINSGKRQIIFNDKNVSASEMEKFSSIFWFIPQQNSLFTDATGERRKFFDRLVYYFDHNHSASINRYEYYLKERIKILLMDNIDISWLKIVEQKLAAASSKISISRRKILLKIQNTINELNTPFPKTFIKLESELDEAAENLNEEELTEFSLQKFIEYRSIDKEELRSHFGAHKTDFVAIDSKTLMPARMCSTGQQHAIVVTILLGLIETYYNTMNSKPIILLDEIFTHIDVEKKNYLADYLNSINMQVFVTSTEEDLCHKYASFANKILL